MRCMVSMKRTVVCFSIMNSFKGFGALCAPLSATQFAQSKHWSFHYLLSLILSLFNLILLAAIFRFRGQDGVLLHLLYLETRLITM